ncbi:MAG TPA: hypothetical protein VFW28_01280 [Micropepsaceae bacterium]|nr:hypothetical protein [Micropepsaceae bacterium]
MTTQLTEMTPDELAQYGYERAKDVAFDAILQLWRRREAEGMKQSDIAATIGWDPALVCRKLQGPSNWTLKTIGALVQGLAGELEIKVVALEDPLPDRRNYHAYAEYPTPVLTGVNVNPKPISPSGTPFDIWSILRAQPVVLESEHD